VQVKRLIAAPAALAGPLVAGRAPPPPTVAHQAAPPRAAWEAGQSAGPHLPAAAGAPVPPGTPAAEVTALLDEAFGPEPG